MIGLVTIGQAPRNDIAATMLGTDHQQLALQTGALDLLGLDQIRQLAPRPGEPVLVTRLLDGSEVSLARPRLIPHLQSAVDRAAQSGATAICVLCTGSFDGLTSQRQLLFPDRVVRGVVDALLPEGAIGVMMPHSDQEAGMIEKWGTPQRRVVVDTVSPYQAPVAPGSAGRRLESSGADLIVMDCMGYTRDMLTTVRDHVSVPVILSNSLVGAVLRETVSLAGTVEQAV